MSYILSIYSINAFKEYLLPAVDNADYSLIIQSSLFGLSADEEIPMEILDGKWRIKESKNWQFIYAATKEEYRGQSLSDGDVLSGTCGYSEALSIVVRETEASFGVCHKYSLQNVSEITIGKHPDNIFSYDNLKLVSSWHGAIVRYNTGYVIEDRNSSNGIFINSKRMVGAAQLSYGDCIDIFGLRIIFLGNFIAVNTDIPGLVVRPGVLNDFNVVFPPRVETRYSAVAEKKMFHRAPRNLPKIENEPIEIEAPPAPKELNAQPTYLAIGPSLTMALPMMMGCGLSVYASTLRSGSASIFMFTGLVTAVGSAIIGTTWAILNMRHAKKKNREDELKRFEAYSEYLIACANDIRSKYESNISAMNTLYPSAGNCIRYNESSVELWNRNTRHEDFLNHRLGTGSIPFQAEINVPKDRFSLINDSLSEKPKMIKESYKMLHDVPVCVDLYKHRMIGIIGGDKKRGCYPIMHTLATQIAAANCYTDVKLVFIYDESRDDCGKQWGFAKWLPHTWAEDKKTRFVAANKTDASEVFYEITKVLRQRSEERTSYSSKKTMPKPYYILFIENPDFLEGELIAKYITDTEDNCGISTLFLVSGYEDLPNSCEYIIENTNSYRGVYGVASGVDEKIAVDYDLVAHEQVEEFSRRLSCIEVNEIETGGEIPNVLTFFDMYNVSRLEDFNVMERWKKNRTYDTIKALVGQKAGGADCYLDVHEKYHGPHGLVAGTTGSGKSETLQTYMLSLALNYSPDDIGFFVIDYKGGGMANLFNGLPHMIGQISNLSGNQVHRAMVSIKSENVRRQRIFSEHGVNNINLYTRLYKNNEATEPVPHMFIIIDEFAELKREEPEFMRELISVAQVGRSLGVHLILATQKPAGTVDDNIWSNSKFRLCLRVQDRQDSTDMLHRPDAAYITQAGRCYMQVGNDELFELFQSAWSGATYTEDAGSMQTEIARILNENGRAALVGSHAKIKQREMAKVAWIAALLEVLTEACRSENIEIENAVYENQLMTALVDKFFELAEKKGIEYPVSDYNIHRIQDLVTIYAGMNEKSFSVASKEHQASQVIYFATVEGKKLPEMKEKTQLDAVVEYLAKIASSNGYVRNHKLWLDVLKTKIYLEELNGYSRYAFDNGYKEQPDRYTLDTMVGLYDDPVNQAQNPLSIDLAENGNHLIIGTVVSGKSTFLMTYIYSLTSRYTPDVVNLYILDFSSRMLGAFENLAHVGGVVYENDEEKVSKFFNMISQILEERKRLFKGGSFSQYLRANGQVVPAIVVVIDNMGALRTKTNFVYDDLLMMLLKEGGGYGINFIVTASGFGMSEISNRMADNFKTSMCLEMSDRNAYGEVMRTVHVAVRPEENVKGRGIAKVGDSILEYQTALCVEAEDDYKRGELVVAHCEKINAAWTGKRARKIPEIPEKPVWSEFSELEETITMAQGGRYLPVGYDKVNATVYGIDLNYNYCYTLSGKSRTGKTNMLKLIALSAGLMNSRIVVVDFDGDLKNFAESINARYVDSVASLDAYYRDLLPDFKARNAQKRALADAGKSDEEIFEAMQSFEKLFILIGNLPAFVNKVHMPGDGVADMSPFTNNLLTKGALHNVYWIGAYNQDDTSALGMGVMNSFLKDKKGAHMGGAVNLQKALSFDYMNYNDQNKVYKPGLAQLSAHEEDETNLIVVPLVGNV